MQGLLTTKEACDYLRIGRTTLYKLWATKKIRKVKIRGATRWRLRDLERLAG